MAKRNAQHTGDDQLVYGMPKHMVGTSGGNVVADEDVNIYWQYQPKSHACEKCQAMKVVLLKEKPGPVHPNCKCEVKELKGMKINGRTVILIPPGVDISANIAEAKRKFQGM